MMSIFCANIIIIIAWSPILLYMAIPLLQSLIVVVNRNGFWEPCCCPQIKLCLDSSHHYRNFLLITKALEKLFLDFFVPGDACWLCWSFFFTIGNLLTGMWPFMHKDHHFLPLILWILRGPNWRENEPMG